MKAHWDILITKAATFVHCVKPQSMQRAKQLNCSRISAKRTWHKGISNITASATTTRQSRRSKKPNTFHLTTARFLRLSALFGGGKASGSGAWNTFGKRVSSIRGIYQS